ncbi:hypothetical protein [Candidatus Nitrotoga sp. BS]|uniref:hypothetical protein n=1 Tax=Candidatus Nitrotoga sp. BS TaxID=2890408 RepID=UPI001EF3BF7F|nr:hypothetical protein [Candidatus Nitrotoga sp. BS]
MNTYVIDVPMQREAQTFLLLIWLNNVSIYWCSIINELRAAMKTVKDAHPFAILVMVMMSGEMLGFISFSPIYRTASETQTSTDPFETELDSFHDASPWIDAPIITPSVAHHMSLEVKNCTQLRHVTNQDKKSALRLTRVTSFPQCTALRRFTQAF